MFYLMKIMLCALAAAFWLFAGPPAHAFDAALMDGVVRVKPDWPMAARGVGASGRPRHPEGSGIAVLPGGYVATNVHVLGEATKVDVVLNDGRVLAAEIVGRDVATDIALIKVPADLPVPKTAPPTPLGAPVCAVGNQFGIGLSVTCGVVSAVNRAGMGFNEIEDFIQTDTSINPGGSGGGLFDGQDRLVGMVSAIFTKESDADIGVNFASSAELVLRVAEDLKAFGKPRRGEAGFEAAPLPPRLAKETGGVMVTRVSPDGPAFKAGIDAGDVIRSAGGRPVRTPEGLRAALALAKPDTEIALTIWRGGKERTAPITLVPSP